MIAAKDRTARRDVGTGGAPRPASEYCGATGGSGSGEGDSGVGRKRGYSTATGGGSGCVLVGEPYVLLRDGECGGEGGDCAVLLVVGRRSADAARARASGAGCAGPAAGAPCDRLEMCESSDCSFVYSARSSSWSCLRSE